MCMKKKKWQTKQAWPERLFSSTKLVIEFEDAANPIGSHGREEGRRVREDRWMQMSADSADRTARSCGSCALRTEDADLAFGSDVNQGLQLLLHGCIADVDVICLQRPQQIVTPPPP